MRQLPTYPYPAPFVAATGLRVRLVSVLALSWGLCAFFPVGLMYLNMLVLTVLLAIVPGVAERLRRLRNHPLLLPILLYLIWTVLMALVSGPFPDTPTRLFHTARVALVLCLGLLLTPREARLALLGLVIAAMMACLLVAVQHVWGLPEWVIWKSLIKPHNNFSSGNMITLAIAAGVLLCVMVRPASETGVRWLAFTGALVAAVTVALHAVSRNAQMLLVLLPIVVVVYRFRSLRAVLVAAMLVVLAAGVAWESSPTLQSRFAEIGSNLQSVTEQSRYNSSIGVRWRMYQEAASTMLAHPITGSGVGSWAPRWQAVWATLDQHLEPQEFLRFSEINNPHNDFLLAGMETGIPGMLILVWLFIRCLALGWRNRSTSGNITVMMASALVLTAMVNAPLRDAAFGMTLLWLLAASLASHQASWSRSPR